MAKSNPYITAHLDHFYSIPTTNQAARTSLSRELMAERRLCRSMGIPRKIFRKMAAHIYRTYDSNSLLKPTRQNLLNLLRSLRQFADSPIRDYSTEYYSACGMDDYQLELRHQAQQDARFLERLIFCS